MFALIHVFPGRLNLFLGGDLIYPVSGTALEPTDVCFVDLTFFNTTLQVNQVLLFALMMFFAAELKESEKRMRNLAHIANCYK